MTYRGVFNLSDIYFFKEDYPNYLDMLSKGLVYAKKWQAKTHLDSLKLIANKGLSSDYLKEGLNIIDTAVKFLPND